jgi:hypothetical protein
MLGKGKCDPNSPDFDYDEWRKSQGIKPSLEITIAVKSPEGDEENESEEMGEEDEPDEYKKFKKENSVKSVKDVLNKTKRSI